MYSIFIPYRFLSDIEMGPVHSLSKGHTRLRGEEKKDEDNEIESS